MDPNPPNSLHPDPATAGALPHPWQVWTETSPSRSMSLGYSVGMPAATVGRLVGFTPAGRPLIRLPPPAPDPPLQARSACALAPADLGAAVVLAFENGDREKPIILGRIQPPAAPGVEGGAAVPVEASLDGERVILTARKEIVLRCGKASITLTRAGKVLIRGAYLLSRSSGANRIKGGSVQIN